MIVLITGGARSGKSSFAEQYASHLGSEGIYIATAQPFDEEMRQRIESHRLQREAARFFRTTVEEPYNLSGVLQQLGAATGCSSRIEDSKTAANIAADSVVLVDCLTLWLSNWLLRYEEGESAIQTVDKIDGLLHVISSFTGTLLLVTNEVGSSVVPEYYLGRLFRDLAGTMNQRIAQISDQVFLVAAGIPLELKSRAYKL